MNFVVVGCGLSGSVIARELAEHGHHITILERRSHVGGNMYDYVDAHGILVHKYGPHTFHTNDTKLYDYMCKYNEWQDFHLCCKAYIDGKYTPSPFNFDTVDMYFPEQSSAIKKHINQVFGDREMVTVMEALTCTDPIVSRYAEFLFVKDYRLYTSKQWGLQPEQVDPSILARVPLRMSYNDGCFNDKYQVMPKASYSRLFTNILRHDGIDIQTGCGADDYLDVDENNKRITVDGDVNVVVVFTGALDELFGCCYGALPYRSLMFRFEYSNDDSFQPAAVVAYPQEETITRIVEYKKLQPQEVSGTSYVAEIPVQYQAGLNEPYYPLLTAESKSVYSKYLAKANSIDNLVLCGRLADYKYYNMDQALARALDVSREILEKY